MKNGPNTDGNKLFCDIETVSEPESIEGINEGPKNNGNSSPKSDTFRPKKRQKRSEFGPRFSQKFTRGG